MLLFIRPHRSLIVALICLLSTCASYVDLPADLDGLIGAMESDDMGRQAAAAVKIDTQFGKAGLLTALKTGAARGRAQAVRRLSRLRDKDVVRALMDLAPADPQKDMRVAAISALGVIGDLEAKPIPSAMTIDRDDLIREVALDALRKLDAAAK